MIQINRAILHILDANSGIKVISDLELDLENNCNKNFISKHLKKLNDEFNFKTGRFNKESEFKSKLVDYKESRISFVSLSKYISEIIYETIAQSDRIHSSDVIVCDYSIDGITKFAILKCNNKIGFVHQVSTVQNGVRNEIINHFAILPNTTQNIDECVIINLESLDIIFRDKTYYINGKDINIMENALLECLSNTSPEESIKQMKNIVSTIATSYGKNVFEAAAKVKSIIQDSAELDMELDIMQLGKDVFIDSEVLQETYANEVRKMEIPEKLKISKTLAIRSGKTQKIKTDTGIELTIPVDYYKNKDFMEFINNPNGTISIALKNINQITNK